MQKLMKKIVLGVCLLLWFPLTVLGVNDTNQKPEVKMTNDRIITWDTYDTKATSKITWKTEGYTIKTYPVLSNDLLRTKEYGNPVYKKPYGLFYMKKEYENILGVYDGVYHIRWKIPKEVVDKQIKNAGTTAQILENNNGKLYLNSFFRTYHNGKVYSPYIYDFYGIKMAESWANPNDFGDYFDIPVPYHSKPVSVEIVKKEYYDNTYQVLSKKEVGQKQPYTFFSPQKDLGASFVNALSRIEHSKVKYREGKNIYLYKVEVLDKKTGKKLEFPENNKYNDSSSKKVKFLSISSHPLKEENKHKREVSAFQGRKWDTGQDGIVLVLYYRYVKEMFLPPSNEGETLERIQDDFTDPMPPSNQLYGVISAEKKGNEAFDVEKGIPTSEKLYSYVVGQRYLISYTFTNYKGTREFLQIKKRLSSVSKKGEPIYEFYNEKVTRSYSYWKVTQLDVYELEKAMVSNYALPNGMITLYPSSSYKKPTVIYHKKAKLINPKITVKVDGTTTVGMFQAQNDTLEIDGKVLMMNHGINTSFAPRPKRLVGPTSISDTVLFRKEMTIATEKENGEFDSDGTIVYRRIASVGESQGSKISFDVEINSVVIHTPTICEGKIENVIKYNQQIQPDKRVASLVLDRNFQITLSTSGIHHTYKGYGYRDYAKYMSKRQVRFPFDVYQNSPEGNYIKAGTWILLGNKETETFYLPTWVQEGYYIIDFRTYAINTITSEQKKQQEELANFNIDHYVATNSVQVCVSGRVFGFAVYDISDYPLWKNVFRIPHTTKLTGIRYRVGTRTRNGEPNNMPKQWTLPLLAGSHPEYPCEGAVSLGYVTRFSIYTIGSMTGKKDGIRIKPRFYYVTKDGKKKEEVDLWYCETFDGAYQRFVKVGTKRDSRNIKRLQLGALYRGATSYEIHNTEKILGMGKFELYDAKEPVYTFGNISIPWQMRTFIGTKDNRPSTISDTTVRKSFQKWYGEYYLPATLYAVKKDFDIWDWARKYGKLNGGINGLEPFWKSKRGYILVNFDIETIKDGSPYLSYINRENEKDGYCNMWKMAGYQYKKEDCRGNMFILQDGDYAFFHLDRSVKDDYISGGTH